MVLTSEITGSIIQTLFWMFGLFILGLLGFIVMHVMRFKIKVRCRIKVNNRTIAKDVRAREYTKDGTKYWQLLTRVNGRKNVEVPGEECIDITDKGKFIAEAYINPTGEFTWIRTIGKDESKKFGEFEPFSTEDRITLMSEFEKADAKKGKDIKEMIMILGPMGILGLVVIMAIIFSADIADSIVSIIDKVDKVMLHAEQVLQRADQISNGRQAMVPADSSGVPPG